MDGDRFTMKTGENHNDGHAFTHAKFTPRGIQRIAALLAGHNLDDKAA
nr:hypothetical protein [Cronobacter dublinensis]